MNHSLILKPKKNLLLKVLDDKQRLPDFSMIDIKHRIFSLASYMFFKKCGNETRPFCKLVPKLYNLVRMRLIDMDGATYDEEDNVYSDV